MPKLDRSDALIVLGWLLATGGLYLFAWPLAVVAVGMTLLYVGVRWAS